LILLDSGFRRNDGYTEELTIYEFISIELTQCKKKAEAEASIQALLSHQTTRRTDMRFWGYLLVGLLGLNGVALADITSNQSDMIKRMKTGGHILMIRHALAPGTGDPANFRIGDCATQRNLDERGRNQARNIGDWLRTKGIGSARVYSSQWCRCLETARLLEMGSVTELPALNSFYELRQNREPNLTALRKFIAEQPADGDLIILVTHFVTISAIADEAVSSGEGVLLKLNEDAPYEIVGRINFRTADVS
jgi:phosphohistidine phosphatase SixA